MSTGSHGNLWREFEHDPRDPTYAGMRASERDRDVVREVLASAYADGRLDREEFDDRTTAVAAAKTYGALVPPLSDLTADAVPSRLATPDATELRSSAEQYYRHKLRETLFEFLIPNLICWAIWFMTGHDSFIWPVFVTIPTLIHVLQVASSKQRTIEARTEKLQRRRAEELEGSVSGRPVSAESADSADLADPGAILRDEPRPDHVRRDEG